jgi:hypothetical protein
VNQRSLAFSVIDHVEYKICPLCQLSPERLPFGWEAYSQS